MKPIDYVYFFREKENRLLTVKENGIKQRKYNMTLPVVTKASKLHASNQVSHAVLWRNGLQI